MNSSVRDCVVEGYQYLIPNITLPDANDRHVLAAAIHSGASAIITYNLKDFPKKILSEHDIEAWHPDDFITNLLDSSVEMVCLAAKRHRSSLKNPPKTVEQYLATLAKQSLKNTVDILSAYENLI